MGGKEWPTQPLEPGWYCMMCRNEGTFIQNAATEKLTQPVVQEEQLSFDTTMVYSATSSAGPSGFTKVFSPIAGALGGVLGGTSNPYQQLQQQQRAQVQATTSFTAKELHFGGIALADKGPCNVCGCRLYMKVEKVEHDPEQ